MNDSNIKISPKCYKIKIFNKQFAFNTDAGIFSKNYLDYGSKLLLEHLPYNNLKGNVLDIGCGYGPIGIIVAKMSNVFVHMIDINIKAIELANINAKLNSVKNVYIYESNIYDKIGDTFNLIITNPPIRAGKKTVYEILEKAKDYLTEKGELWFVMRKQQGAESLIKYLSNLYEVTIIKKSKGYFVIRAQK